MSIRQKKGAVDRTLEYIAMLILVVMLILTSWQVFTRFILNNPSSWSEEVTRYLLFWLTFLGSAIGLKYGSHMGLVLLLDRIKNIRIKMLVHFVNYGICAIVGYIFVRYGYDYMLMGFKRSMHCFDFPMGYIYSIIPISGLIIIINSLELMIKDIPIVFSGREGVK